MIKKLLSFVLLVSLTFAVFAQPAGYYDNATGKTGATLKTALYNIIKGHTSISYDALYNAYQTTDNIVVSGNNRVYDMYSIKADGSANYYFSHVSGDRCGNYSSEGDCYNREHSLPQSWFNSSSPMVSDLFHVYPTDGKVNGMRSNYPFGKVSNATFTSTNGSKLGSSDPATGYSGTVFEPIDEYKGDFARTYFYMATRYENVIASWASNGSAGQVFDGTAFPAFKTWFKDLMLAWNQLDPVSQKERDRNNAVYAIQNNRNPYIDHPEYADAVWSSGPIALNFTSSAITTATINQLYTYSVSVTGPVGATFTITTTTKPAWLTLTNGSNGHATLSGTPNAAGSFDVTLSVTDGTTTKTQSFAILVAALDGLKFTSTPTLSATTGSPYSYSVVATNASNPLATISITATTKPAWLTITSTGSGTATLSGTPSAAGTNSVVLSAYDGTTTITQSFVITVSLASLGNTETFEKMPALASNYATRDWVGDNGISWHATQSRTDQIIHNRAICFEKSGNPYLLSQTITGGCSKVTFKHKQIFSSAGGSVTLFINDQQIGVPVSVTSVEQTALFNGFNYTGDFTIKLVSNGVTQIGIDDLTWAPNLLPTIANITNLPVSPTTNEDVVISANITDSDGTIQQAWVKWGTTAINLDNNLSMTLDGGVYKATIPAQSQGTIYLSVNAKDNLDAVSTVLYDYDVVQNEKPIISNIATDPLSPLTGQAVKVSATITDSDGSIEDAWVKWGTSSSSLTNQVNMTLVGGSYEAIIPAQSQVGTIYLSINVRDDLGGVSTSLYSFSVAQGNLLPQITNIVKTPQSPLTGQSVKVSASITDPDGTIQEAYLKWGTTSSSLTNQVVMSLASGSYEATIPAQAQAGTIYLSVNAKDNLNALSTELSSYTVTQNQLPVITNISKAPQAPLIGQPVTVSASIADSDGTIQEAWVKWGGTALNLDNTLTMALDGSVYKATIPAQAQPGIVYLSVNAKDNLNEESTELYSYSVVNQLPVITNISKTPQSPLTGQSVKVSASITDPDGTIQEAYLKWGTTSSSLTNQVVMSLASGSYEATIPAQAQAGTIYLSVNAKDNLDALSTELSSYTVTQNQLPVITNISKTPQAPLIGQPVTVSASIADSDGTIQEAWVKWGTTALNLDNTLTMALDGSVYKATIPAQAQPGIVYLSVNAKDNLNEVSTELYSYSVVNQLPVITNISKTPQSPLTGQSVKVSASITDPDGTIQEAYLKWGTTSSSLTNQVVMSLASGSYEATIPAQAQAGTIYLSVNAKDNLNALSTELSSYTVTQNQLPVITNISKTPQAPLIGQPVTVSASIADSDGTIQEAWVKWGTTALNLDNTLTMALDGSVYKATIPAQAQPGIVYLSVNAKDNLNEESTELYSYSVVNQLPVITNISKTPQSPLTGQSVKVSASITDPDGTIQEAYLKWGTTSSSLTNQVAMSLASGSYEAIIPAQAQAGTIYLSVNAKDNLNALSTELSSYTVTQNQLPVITNISKTPQAPLIGQPVTVSASIADSDGTIQEAWVKWGITALNLDNTLTMALDGSVYKATIPAQAQPGTIYLSVNAKDNLNEESTELYSYTIPQNQLPVITNISNFPLAPIVGQTVVISSTMTDSDGSIQEVWLDWGIASNNISNRVNMTLTGGVYFGTIPAQSQAGTIYLAVNAKDNLSATTSVLYSYVVSPGTNVNDEENSARIKVYPNPAKNQITVDAQDFRVTKIIISNIIGEKIISIPFNGNKQPIDISQLQPGIYFVMVVCDGSRNTTRIVVY